MVVSVEDWEAACASRSDKWARTNVMLAELHERMRQDTQRSRTCGRSSRRQTWLAEEMRGGSPEVHLVP